MPHASKTLSRLAVEPLLKPYPDVTRLLNRSRSFVYAEMASGALAYHRIGSDRLISRDAVAEYLERRLVKAKS
jgi:excisionase family DNA binding protein